ncbi:RNA-directed DNA polymerase, eukaryota, reverse transcriptase zinc-binding domain protein [Tanacetum coccineum]
MRLASRNQLSESDAQQVAMFNNGLRYDIQAIISLQTTWTLNEVAILLTNAERKLLMSQNEVNYTKKESENEECFIRPEHVLDEEEDDEQEAYSYVVRRLMLTTHKQNIVSRLKLAPRKHPTPYNNGYIKAVGEVRVTLEIRSRGDTQREGKHLHVFIPGRNIQDNILITQELLNGYNRKNGSKRCAMKIDIPKAYDTINWDFLKEVMFTLRKAICMELKLTHICFADDLMVSCNGDVDSLKVVKRALDDFSSVSWLHSNLGKSTIFFGSINERDKGDLLQILPFKCGKLRMKYLGVSLLAKRLGVKDCKILIENVENRINCWKNKTLSYARRIQLIASVLSTMQQYWASVYSLPITRRQLNSTKWNKDLT